MSHPFGAAARAMPIPSTKSFGTGRKRALVLGGGGEYFAAWMTGYIHTLASGGVEVDGGDVVLGTSAGSLVGSALTGGHLRRMALEFDVFARFLALLGKLAHQAPAAPAQPTASNVVAERDLGRRTGGDPGARPSGNGRTKRSGRETLAQSAAPGRRR